jgi:trimethylamine:corrinoid methyltransferase-like protein
MGDELSMSTFCDRESYEKWFNKSKRNCVDIAREKVQEILTSHKPMALPEGVRKETEEIMEVYQVS